MRGQEIKQFGMHEWLAAKDAKERIAVPLGVGDRAIQRFKINRVLLLHVHPATLATEVAGVEDREVQERRKIIATANAPFELLHRKHAFDAEVPGEFPKQPRIGSANDAICQAREHVKVLGSAPLPRRLR